MDRQLRHRFEDRIERRLEGMKYCHFDLGGNDAPQPDPAIGQAAQANTAISKEALDFAKRQYEEGKPRQAMMDQVANQVIQKQLELQDKSSAQADDYLNYMKATFRPVEQGLVNDAQAFDTEAKREELAGRAGADVQQAAGAADAATARDLARYGINPADGAYADAAAGSSLNKTAATVGAMNKARTDARAEGRAFKFDVAGLGRNLPGAGATSTGLSINAGNAAVSNAGAPAANARADAATMQSGYGTAITGNNSAGNLYGNIFNSQIQAYNADQQVSAGISSGLGTLGGMGAYKLIFGSSKKFKNKRGNVDAEKVADDVKKMPIDRWRYRKGISADQADHTGPYAEDFQQRFKVGDGKSIHVADGIGVALAAVKGMAKKVDRLDKRVAMIARMGVKNA